MAENQLAYLPPKNGFYTPPLSRFLPPLPREVISTWVQDNTETGDLVIDPLGANPLLAIEIANAGGRVLFARNNPILWLLLEVMASATDKKDIAGIISKLLLSRQSGTTLEDQLKSIYATHCVDCGEELQPYGYIWDEGAQLPVGKIYQCPACGEEGEKPVSEADIQSLKNLGNIGLQRIRAFQRAVLGGDYEKESIEAALDCYLPRAVFTVMLLVNRLDGLKLELTERRLLQAIFISIFDDANSLWHWPIRDHRHLQLNVPSRFLEKNLWRSIESAAENWANGYGKVSVSYYPKLPPKNGGICLYQRKLADHDDFLSNEKPKAIVAVFPRPNQAFWTFSALWSGWLWGRKGTSPMRSALSRRRYDWYWFAKAILSTMDSIKDKFGDEIPFFGLLPEATPNFYLGLLCGMYSAGFQLESAAYRPYDELIQCKWKPGAAEYSNHEPDARDLIKNYMKARGEPASFSELMMNSLSNLVLQGAIPQEIDDYDETYFRQIQEMFSAQLRDEHFSIAFPSNLQGGSRWWLLDARDCHQPLAERVENFIAAEFQVKSPLDLHDIEKSCCEYFSGNLTPSHELILAVLESYTQESDGEEYLHHLRTGENTASRQKDIEEARDLLMKISNNFGFKSVEPEKRTLLWQDKGNSTIYQFFLKTSCDISTLILKASEDNIPKVIVLPGSRSRLIAFRLREDPRLAKSLEGNWHFLKFRHLRRMAARENFTYELWENLLDGDPPLWEPAEQTPLL